MIYQAVAHNSAAVLQDGVDYAQAPRALAAALRLHDGEHPACSEHLFVIDIQKTLGVRNTAPGALHVAACDDPVSDLRRFVEIAGEADGNQALPVVVLRHRIAQRAVGDGHEKAAMADCPQIAMFFLDLDGQGFKLPIHDVIVEGAAEIHEVAGMVAQYKPCGKSMMCVH